ncbi:MULTISPECIES: glycosyltransferase family 4 protein [Serratia]|uniref:glycosyltransferase family 4 protein n=1 Tax=Serratia TaxID=613 RepID=UPI00094991F2|nr:glycosyltransferase family 4 protein [Serratia marcescens]
MNIMLINTIYSPFKVGGAEVSVQLLAEELEKKGNIVTVLTLHDEKKRKVEKINNVTVVYLPLKNLYWPFENKRQSKIKKILWHSIDNYNIFMAHSVTRELEKFSPDVVHTNNISGFSVAIWNVIKKKKIKLVHTSRDYYLFHPNSTMYGKSSDISPKHPIVKFWSFVKKKASRHVDNYVGISQFIEDFHVRNGFFSHANSSFIYNAVDYNLLEKAKSPHNRIGFIGRLTKDKGFDEFCYYIRELKTKNKEVVAVAAGRFNNDSEGVGLKNLAENCSVRLLGFTTLNDFFSVVDIVILPVKWREPFGRVVVESIFAGKIVLTNSVGGIGELINILPNVYALDDDSIDINRISLNPVGNDIIDKFSSNKVAENYLETYRI